MADTQDFFRAIKENKIETVESLARRNPQLLAATKSRYQCVGYATSNVAFKQASGPSVDMVEKLLALGADPNGRPSEDFSTALHLALLISDIAERNSIVRLLIQYGANVDAKDGEKETPRQQCDVENLATTKDIIDNAQNIRDEFVADQADVQPFPEEPENSDSESEEDMDGASPANLSQENELSAEALVQQVEELHVEGEVQDSHVPLEPEVEELLPQTASDIINDFDRAIRRGNMESVKKLGMKYPYTLVSNNDGARPFMPLERACMLMYFSTPIHHFEEGDPRREFWMDTSKASDMIQLLLDVGAHPNHRGSDESLSALHYAQHANDFVIVKLLLRHGADPNIKDLDHKSPLHYAKKNKQERIHRLLQHPEEAQEQLDIQTSFDSSKEREYSLQIRNLIGNNTFNFSDCQLDMTESKPLKTTLGSVCNGFYTTAENTIPISLVVPTAEEIFLPNLPEEELIKLASNPNIATILGSTRGPTSRLPQTSQNASGGVKDYVVCELLPPLTLRGWLKANGSRVKEPVRQRIVSQVADAVCSIYSAGLRCPNLSTADILVLHGDPKNPDGVQIKVSGYGIFTEQPPLEQFSPTHSPPEVYSGEWTGAADVYALATTIWEVYSGKVPYHNLKKDEIYAKVASGIYLPCPKGCSQQVYRLLIQCWNLDPERRPQMHYVFHNLRESYSPVPFHPIPVRESFAFRSKVFRESARKISDPENERENVGHFVAYAYRAKIRRDNVLKDTLKCIRSYEPVDWRNHGLNISFNNTGETGLDWGAVTKEWIELLCGELFSNDTIFHVLETNLVKLKPDLAWKDPEKCKSLLRFAGQLLGFMMWHGEMADIPLVRSVYFHLLGHRLQAEDYGVDDEVAFGNIMRLLVSPGDEIPCYYLTMSVEDPSNNEVDLVPGGRDIDVCETNRHEYFYRKLEYTMYKECKEGIAALVAGFRDMVPHDLTEGFLPHELQLMVTGNPEIDINDLRENTCYRNCSAGTDQIKWLWTVLGEWTPEMHRKFLYFVTGTTRGPPAGFESLLRRGGTQRNPVTIKLVDDDEVSLHSLPTSHACFNTLDLPRYQSLEILRVKLTTAVELGHGFGNE